MKYLIIFLFTNLVFIAFNQDTTYFDSDWKKLKNSKNATYFEIINFDELDTNKAVEWQYFINGKIHSEIHYSNYRKDIYDGKYIVYFKNGVVKKHINYKQGKINGKLLTNWENGNPKRIESFENDKSLEGKCFDSLGHDIAFFDYWIPPYYPGGKEELIKYLGNQMVYPKKMIKNAIEGKIYIRFIVDKSGSISNAKVLKGGEKLFEEEALRVVREMPKWIPGKIEGEPVRTYFDLPVNFRLTD